MKIMVVEDEADIALILKFALKDAGHEVIGPVSTGAEAFRMGEEEKPDLALIDINLKDGKTGQSLATRLMNVGVPSVYVSGNPEDALKTQDASLGFIAKPYRINAVIQAVDVVEVLLSGEIPVRVPEGLNLFDKSREKTAALHR